MFILGSCLALNIGYPGYCRSSLSTVCSHKGCYCDQCCYKFDECCSDIANISCHPNNDPIPSLSPTLTSTNTQ